MKERDHLEQLGTFRKIFKWIFRQMRHKLDSSDFGQRPKTNSCEHSNEPSGSIKGREFLY
jgi:hypothetical protein